MSKEEVVVRCIRAYKPDGTSMALEWGSEYVNGVVYVCWYIFQGSVFWDVVIGRKVYQFY